VLILRVADTIAETGVISQLVLTKRYHPATHAFLDTARTLNIAGARSCYLHGAFLGGDFATGWRLEHGALLDLGPHLLDLLDAAIGPITAIRSTGDPRRWIELTCEHTNGAVSQASLSGSVNLPRPITRVELFGPAPSLAYDTAAIDHEEGWPILRRDPRCSGGAEQQLLWRGRGAYVATPAGLPAPQQLALRSRHGDHNLCPGCPTRDHLPCPGDRGRASGRSCPRTRTTCVGGPLQGAAVRRLMMSDVGILPHCTADLLR
jgi:predicted dehydrogenase